MTFEHVQTRVAARGRREHPRARRPGGEPPRRRPSGSSRSSRSGSRRSSEHRSRPRVPGRAGADRARAGRAPVFQDLKRQLGVIDFGDQITLALRIVERTPRSRDEYRARFDGRAPRRVPGHQRGAGRADRTAVFGDGHPGDGGRRPRPEHLRLARREPVQPARVPASSSAAPTARPRRSSRCTRTSARAPGSSAAADTLIAPLPAAQRPDPDKAAAAAPAQRRGRASRSPATPTRWTEARWIADRVVRLHDERRATVVGVRRAVPQRAGCSSSLQQAFEEREVPVEIVGLAGLLKLPEVVEVLAYARAVADPLASVELAPHPAGPAVPRRLQGPRARRRAGRRRELRRCATRTRTRARPRRSCSPRRSSTSTRSRASRPTRARAPARGVPRRAGRAPRRGPPPRRRVPRRDHPPHRPPRPSSTPTLDPASAAGDQAQPRRVPRRRCTRSRRSRASSRCARSSTTSTPSRRLDKQEWAPVQPSDEDSVKVMTIHVGEGPRVRPRVRARHGARAAARTRRIQQNPAERGKSLDFELRGDAAILPALRRRADALQAGAARRRR